MAIAVEPQLLADALSQVLARADVDEVVEPDRLGREHIDAAIVTIILPETAGADVVIELPDTDGNSGVGRVRSHGSTEPVWIGDAEDILDLLDRHCPGPRPRHPA